KISGTGEALEDFDIVPYSTRDFEARLVNLSKDIAPSESGHISFTPQAVASPKKRPYPPRFQGLEVGDVMVQSPPEEVIYSYRPPQGERNILKRFKEAGQALNTAGNPTAFTYSPTDIAEHARASGLAAEVVAKVEGGVVRVTPLAPDAMLRLPAAISNFSGRISARASTATRSVGALKIMVDGNPVAELPLGDVTRTYYFSGSGHEISIISDIPSASYIIKKIVLRDAWSQ
ncbi:hypothetical protein V5F77_17565, partial [Xanthobacter sp. DSM 24535]|uniref:hypothetical protein n=1 Tax=Roseixanthobacter psychrophilus TaxID=3119917 RepID=UPI00372B308C